MPNILRSKGNLTMKFCQLIDYNIRIIFIEKWYTKCGGETNIELLKKTKRGLELVSLPHFLHNFWRKMFLLIYSINWPGFIVWLSLLREKLGNMCNYNCNVMNFEMNLIFLIKSFFNMTKKSRQKFNYLDNKKSF